MENQSQQPYYENKGGVFSTFREMVQEVVEYRELLFQMTLRDVRIRYKQAVMGFGWAIFMPMMIVGAGLLIKMVMAQMSGGRLEAASAGSMMVKALPWSFFVGAIGFATNSLTSNSSLVSKIYFPREIFPLSATLAQMFDTAIGCIVLAVILFGFMKIGISIEILWILPLVLLLLMLTIGAGLLLSCANLFFRDVKYIVQVLITFGIFFTPVFYDGVNLGPAGCRILMLNPLAPIFEGLRLSVIDHHNLARSLVVAAASGQDVAVWQASYLLYSAIWAIVLFFGSWVIFHKLESIFAEYV
ncbi:MAG: ABC transporter permease [Syntrophobacteraceae bacterium]|jgi:ABC-type polysaccharide/polyol phosphate export permease